MTTFLTLLLTLCFQLMQCSSLQLVPLEDEIQDAVHNTHFNLSPETTTTSRSAVLAQMEEYLSDDYNLLHSTNSTIDRHHQLPNITDTKNTSSTDDESSIFQSRATNASVTTLDGDLDSTSNSSNETALHPKLFPDAVEEDRPNATIVMSGLNDDAGGSMAVSINESRSKAAVDEQVSVNVLEDGGDDDDDDRPSVLDFHPVVNRSIKGNPTIRFRSGVPEEWHPYTKILSTYLESYDKDAQEKNVHCDFERSLGDDQTCRFDLVYLGPSCTKENNFGYGIGKPCVLLSPAKIAHWVPTSFDNETTSIPDEVHRLMRIFNSNFMFVTCEGEHESDRVNIGPMAYLPPYQGFPSYFFPYKGDKVSSYVSPLMAVEFLNPTNSTLISVVCRAWARNLPDLPRQASLRFSLQVN